MVRSCREMAAGQIEIFAGLDDDDPKIEEYNSIDQVKFFLGARKCLSHWTNELADIAIKKYGTDSVYLVSMGDDHVVRSNFWDVKMTSILRLQSGPGFAYGDDMMNGSGLCTCWMVSAQVVEALGWMMLPKCKHMYVDNAIMEIGEAANRLSYITNLTIEHMHPSIGKSATDVTYQDAETSYIRDLEQFRIWRNSPDFEREVNIVRDLRWPV